MPELPDIEGYVAGLNARLAGQRLERLRLLSPFLVRSVDPPTDVLVGRTVGRAERLAKRIVLGFEGELFAVLHLMIAGRLQWRPAGAKPPGKIGLAALDFEAGTLLITEASTQKRASLHVVAGRAQLAAHDPGGREVIEADGESFRSRLRSENRTLKRALTDPRLFSGIGNAFSDEILHAARLSPVALTSRLSDEEIERLHTAARQVLGTWRDRLVAEYVRRFPGPGEVTAFRPEFAVHGKFEQPCPVCGAPVQRIRYADNECNYCPGCQTGGRILADRSLSRLLKGDWPRTLEELER
jgi:formamidopyrimidine-DNA glycosylase